MNVMGTIEVVPGRQVDIYNVEKAGRIWTVFNHNTVKPEADQYMMVRAEQLPKLIALLQMAHRVFSSQQAHTAQVK